MSVIEFNQSHFNALEKPRPVSHKGDNGRLLVIGGSKLFHAAVFWSADVASRFVDLVHFASPSAENSDLVRVKLKSGFWNGIVVDWQFIETYVEEDAAIVIGPGMPRTEGMIGAELATSTIVNDLLTKFPKKNWVVDGGALQEVNPKLIGESMIITPHQGECVRLLEKLDQPNLSVKEFKSLVSAINNPRAKKFDDLAVFLQELSLVLNRTTIMLKGVRDLVVTPDEAYLITGGNEGLTKGGSGDVLAGLVGSFYTRNPAWLSAASASYLLKAAADDLYEKVGPYYNTSDLVDTISYTMKRLRS